MPDPRLVTVCLACASTRPHSTERKRAPVSFQNQPVFVQTCPTAERHCSNECQGRLEARIAACNTGPYSPHRGVGNSKFSLPVIASPHPAYFQGGREDAPCARLPELSPSSTRRDPCRGRPRCPCAETRSEVGADPIGSFKPSEWAASAERPPVLSCERGTRERRRTSRA